MWVTVQTGRPNICLGITENNTYLLSQYIKVNQLNHF